MKGKSGRNKEWCKAYRARGQREINCKLRIERHLRKYPNDSQAKAAL